MKTLMLNYLAIFFVLITFEKGISQNVISPASGGNKNWNMGGNQAANNTPASTIFGTLNGLNQPIFIYTGGAYRAQFTTGGALTNGIYPGDGLRIMDPQSNNIGHLDLWTGASQTTHIKWDGSGEISGQHTRFEIIGHYGGIWLNAQTTSFGPARIFFNIEGQEVGRFGNNGTSNPQGFMRVGLNSNNLDAARRLEVFDNLPAPQFRITFKESQIFTDFQTTGAGDLAILPFDNTQVATPNKTRNVGIQTTTPGNTLEINYHGASFSPASLNGITATSSGYSGLRFTDLQYGVSVPATSQPGQGVLSVDGNGDVIYINAPGNGFGTCLTPTLLTGTAVMNLNNNFLHFSGQQANDRIGIGTNCTNPLFAKLNVLESSGATGSTIGEIITNSNDAVGGPNVGLAVRSFQTSSGPTGISYYAGSFNVFGSKTCVAVNALANGLASNSANNYAGYFLAQNGNQNIGIYAQAPVLAGINYAAWFEGDMLFNGTLYGANNVMTSDRNLKRDIDTITDALGIIKQLQPKTFFFDSTAHPQMNLSDRRQYGLIAQDVQPVLPELVQDATFPTVYDSLGNVVSASFTYKTLNYNAFIAILMKGMQEQQRKLDSITNAMSAMQSQMNNCCASNARTQNPNNSNSSNTTDVTLSNSENIILNQNVPNPFAEQTSIKYYLPSSIQKAQLLFYDAQGKLIKAVDLEGRGDGQINVFADDLTNGLYTYALVADGKVVDSKRMIKSK